jgi:mitochondrial import receptor subunit TOM40
MRVCVKCYLHTDIYLALQILCQGQLDSDWSFSARFNARLTDRLTLKNSAQFAVASMSSPGGAQFSPELDYKGDDFSASIKSMNPSLLEGGLTGMFIGSYMQSITKRLALGMEAVWQKPAGAPAPEAAVSYAGRYTGDDWIASAQLLTQGGLQASYWRRLTERVETGVDLSLQLAAMDMMTGSVKKEGTATFGAKYEFSRSVFRAQVDSAGKVGCLLDRVVAPAVRVTFAGEIDHVKVRMSHL